METGMTEADRFIIDQLTEGVVLLDPGLRILHCNPSLIDLLEGSPEDLCGEPLSVIAASPEDALLLSESPSQGVLSAKLRSLQGRLIHCELSFSPMIGEGETLLGFSVIVRDSGRRVDLEESLQALARKYRDMALAGSDWFWEVDSTGTYTFVCPEVEDFLGYTPEELFGTSAFDLMPPEEGQRVASIFNRIASRGIPFKNLLNTVLTRSGEVRTVASSGVPLRDSRGGLRGYRGLDREVAPDSGSPWAEEPELKILGRLTVNLPFPAAVIENTGCVRKVSKALCELTGRTQEQLVGKMYETVLSGGPREGPGQSWNSARWQDHIPSPGGTVPVGKTRVPMENPESIYCLEILSPIQEPPPVAPEKPTGVTGIHEGFLVSLASALGGIGGFADILEQGETEQETRGELMEMLRHHSNAVFRTLGSMRNFLEYSAGEFTTAEECFVMSNLTDQVTDAFRLRAESRKICCRVQVELTLQGLWRGPFRGIRAIIFHILNSLSPSCEVLLGVSDVDSTSGSSIVRFSLTVSPTGSMLALNRPGGIPGAAPEFRKALSLSERYAGALGGELLTGTTPSGGYRVWADIPLTRQGEMLRFKGRMNAMIISGNPHMTVLYSRMLQSLGCEVLRFDDSSPVSSALSLLRDGSDASFLLLDADSILKGVNTLGSLDHIPGTDGMNIHKVLLASRVKPGDIQGSLAGGVSALLLKPVRLGRLKACLQLAASVGKGGRALITDNSFPGAY